MLEGDIGPIQKGLEIIKEFHKVISIINPEMAKYVGDIALTVIDPEDPAYTVGKWSYIDDESFEFVFDKS